MTTEPVSTDGVRLLSQRPSLLYKLGEVGADADPAAQGLVIRGPGWDERLRRAIEPLAVTERAGVFAVRLDDSTGVPLPVATVLERLRTDWFPGFVFRGRMHSVFQPVVDLRDGSVFGREALVRGSLGRGVVTGAELHVAAVAHDALFSFDARTRAIALQTGLPRLPTGERLFVKLDLAAVLDVEGSVRSTWPVVEEAGGRPESVGLELMGAERHPDLDLLRDLAAAHRERGALISLDDLSAGTDALRVLEAVRPAVAKLSLGLCKDIEASPARGRLVGALVEVAHELGCRVVAVGVERDSELEQVQALGVDLGQGFYLGQPTAEMLPVQRRLVARAAA